MIPAAFVLTGLIAGVFLPHRLQVQLTPATLALFLPALIFEGAWEIDARALRRTALPIFVLAVPGVLFGAAVIGAAVVLGSHLAVVAGLAVGAILAATDPVAVLALFRRLDLPLDLRTIVEGESIANDAVAVVVVQSVLAFAFAASVSPGAVTLEALAVSLVGIAVGIGVALVATGPLRAHPNPWYGVTLTVAIAYGAYAAATLLHASGIFASAAAGVAVRSFALEKSERRVIEHFWEWTATLANGAVFVLVGLSIDVGRVAREPQLVVTVLAAVVFARALLVYVFTPLPRALGATPAWRHALALAGVRGGLSLALALGLPANFPNRAEVLDAVFAVVLVTIVVQGSAIEPLLRRLDLRQQPNG